MLFFIMNVMCSWNTKKPVWVYPEQLSLLFANLLSRCYESKFLSHSRPFSLYLKTSAARVTWHRQSMLYYIRSLVYPLCDCVVGRKSRCEGGSRDTMCRNVWRTGENLENSICHCRESIGSRSSVNSLCPSSHSTSKPVGAESITTVGFSVVNICLTRWPASLGDCPAFSAPWQSCCSN